MLSTAALPAHEYVLDNGLKVVLVSAAAAPVATLLVVYRVGARNEAVGYTGSSHLLEHMLFKGTPKNNRRNGRAFADVMNEIGAAKNATTWIDRTNYFETVPSGFLDLAIEMEADRMRSAFIADADRRSEMTVVRNELERNDNNTARVLSSAVVATAFREHPYHHPTIGWRTDVEGVPTERLRELYDTYYHPNNATAFVVGDFDAQRTRETIERYFGALPRAAHAIPDVHTEEPPQAGERSVVVKRPGDTAIVAFAYHTPAAFGQRSVLSSAALTARTSDANARHENDSYALDVLSRILGRGRTSRLSRALVDTGLALDVSAWNWASRDPGLFQVVANVRPGVAAADVRGEIERVLEAMANDGPEPAEIERARTQIDVQRAFARDGTLGLAQRLGEFEAVGSWRLDDDYLEQLRDVTVERVRDVARAYVHEDNRTVGMLVPGTAKTFDVVAFEPVEARPPADEPVEAAPLAAPREQRSAPFETRIAGGVAANGLGWRYVENRENPTVHLRGLLAAGAAYAPESPLLPAIVAEMLSRGTRSQARRDIEERLERAGVRRGYSVDDDAGGGYDALAFRFAVACTTADLPLALETLAEELREPRFDEAELALVKSEFAGSLRLARTSTHWRSSQRFLQLAYEDGDPNAGHDVDALLAGVEAIGVADVRSYWTRRVLAVPPLVSAAGAPDAATFGRLLETTLGEVPFASRVRPAEGRVTVHARPARDERSEIELERKSNVDIIIGRATTLVRADDDYLAATIGNGILGQSTLSSRLGLRLRDREGLTYGVTSAFLGAGKVPGPWRIGVSVNPANVERAIASALAVLEQYATHGPTEREIVQQRNSMAGSQAVALATNAGIAAQLERMAYYALPGDYVDRYRERLEAISRAEVALAAARYFAPSALIVAAAGSFTPAPASP
jgi:zinc protease